MKNADNRTNSGRYIMAFSMVFLVLCLFFSACASSGGKQVKELEKIAMAKILGTEKEAMRFSLQLFDPDGLLNPRTGDKLEALFGSSTAKVEVIQYDSESGFLVLELTEAGMKTNYDDYIFAGKQLTLRKDKDSLPSTGGPASIDG